MYNLFFDSSAILTWFRKQDNFELVEDYLEKCFQGKINGFLTQINSIEIMYQIARENDFLVAQEILGDLENVIGINVLGLTWDLRYEAAKYKVPGNIALPDCILLAQAKSLNAKIITSDPEFKQYSNEVEFIWI